MDALILGDPEFQAHAVAVAARVPAHIEFARGLVLVAILVLALTVALDLALPERGPRR
ncbi:hypothetical protein ABEV34_06855 [Methylorubrum rhodesianum]|uniref:hypothetical protein n=1 Tax=Methylorubrum TaxID=2282523 RepID=UPI001611A2EA|nr:MULTISPECIES: hypothetical protein [Methylorubrum]MBB5765687.1 hypothetical protein [Methylorubrum rhodesianum]